MKKCFLYQEEKETGKIRERFLRETRRPQESSAGTTTGGKRRLMGKTPRKALQRNPLRVISLIHHHPVLPVTFSDWYYA